MSHFLDVNPEPSKLVKTSSKTLKPKFEHHFASNT